MSCVPHPGWLASIGGLRLTVLGHRDWFPWAVQNPKQDTSSGFLTDLDGLLLQFCTQVSEGGIKPDSKFLTGALLFELQKAPLTLRSCSFEASSPERDC